MALTSVTGLQFDAARQSRRILRIGDLDLPFPRREALLRNRHGMDGLKDLADGEARDESAARRRDGDRDGR